MNFYQQPIESLITDFHSDIKAGLRDEDIENTRRKYGKNSLKAANSRSFLKILLAQFISPLVIILIAAAMFSFYLGQVRDGCILLIIVVTNALIGFYQEWKSENIIASLKNLVVNKCNVIRNGKASQINAEDLVPGDLVQLYEGDGIPADLRLIEANGFSANEFILTGESLPASKDPLFKTEETLLIGDIKNCVFMGTTAARGNAKGLVYACGMQTEIGKISISSEKIKTVEAPVQTEIADIAKKISYATLVIGLILFCTRLLLHDSLGAALVFAVSIAAAMVPEGLPAQISAALALAAGRLSKKNAIVKRLSAAQTLGSATVIASDKTGTITKNEMTITGCHFNNILFSVSGLGYAPEGEIQDDKGNQLNKDTLGDMKVFFLSGYLSSTGKVHPPDPLHKSWYSMGDPTEGSFAVLAMKAGFTLEEIDKEYAIIKSFGFDSFRKRASIIRNHKGKVISFVKGSLESVLASCSKTLINGNSQDLTEANRQQILASSAAFAENALRIIAIAYKDLESKSEYLIEDAENDMIFAGFVTMLDPPHEEVKSAIESVFKAHLKVFMITGDNEITAKAIAKNIGLMNPNNQFPHVVNGTALGKMTDEQVCSLFASRALIFSRVSPDDKYRVVDLLKKQGEIIAVTGDGVNDTLSLKRADIGIAMGLNGSKVAQEAANMILLDDNFSTIVLAVKEGRTIFKNLEKAIKVNLSSNVAELLCVLLGFAGAFWGLGAPILAMQILLIDMVGEMFPILMLTYDPPQKSIMEELPRNPAEKILTKQSMIGILFTGGIMGLASYGAFLAKHFYSDHSANHYEKSLTVTFAALIFCQYMNLLSRRTTGNALGTYFFSNKNLLVAFAFSISCLMLIIYVPLFNVYFHTAPLLLTDWAYPITAAAICLVIYELRKKVLLKRVKPNRMLDNPDNNAVEGKLSAAK